MKYFVIEDGRIRAITPTREDAIEMIKSLNARQTHWLKSDYYIIKGEEIFLKREELSK